MQDLGYLLVGQKALHQITPGIDLRDGHSPGLIGLDGDANSHQFGIQVVIGLVQERNGRLFLESRFLQQVL